MSVYVDESRYRFGNMIMCHMFADTHEELVEMAKAVGVDVKWIQYAGTAREHFDICKAARQRAVDLGANEVSSKELIAICKRKKEGMYANSKRSV